MALARVTVSQRRQYPFNADSIDLKKKENLWHFEEISVLRKYLNALYKEENFKWLTQYTCPKPGENSHSSLQAV